MRKKKTELRTRFDIWFDRINVIAIIAITVVCVYPLYYTVIASFSDPHEVISGRVFLWPVKVTLDSYRSVLDYKPIWTGYRNTLFYTVFGTLYSLFLLLPAAYSLSRKELKGRGLIMKVLLFTMYFGGGTIPTYLLMKSLHLLDSPWVMIIPSALNVSNLIITRTFFIGFPQSLSEAAKIDGCGELRVFMKIVLPLSGSIVAVMTLFTAVGYWNSYFNGLMYLNNNELFPLQLVLREVLLLNNAINPEVAVGDPGALESILKRQRLAHTMKYSLIVIANLPILVAYPFVQKYFVKGVMIGSVKG